MNYHFRVVFIQMFWKEYLRKRWASTLEMSRVVVPVLHDPGQEGYESFSAAYSSLEIYYIQSLFKKDRLETLGNFAVGEK